MKKKKKPPASKFFSQYLRALIRTLLCVELQKRLRVTCLHSRHPCKQSCSITLEKFRITTPKSVSLPCEPLLLAAKKLRVFFSAYFIRIIYVSAVLNSYFSTTVLNTVH